VKPARTKALFEIMAQEAIYGIVVFQNTGKCLYINRVAEQLLESDQPRLKDLMPRENLSPLKNLRREFLKHEGLYQDLMIRKASGNTFIANLGNKHLLLDEKKCFLLMIQDVTLQKKMQREITQKQIEIKAAYEDLLKQNRQLKELDLAKDRFIALTTHELRTPISAMCASAEILKMKLYDNPEQMREFVDVIYDQGLQLQTLVNDILDFAKIQADKMDFYIELRDPVPIARDVLDSFMGMAETNQIKIKFSSPAQPTECYFDPVRLRQILSNIVNNAIKFNRPEGSVHLFFEEDADTKRIRILVADTGLGVPKSQWDKVFNEFETIGPVNQHYKGTGLGMPISRKLAQGMGGDLFFDSTPNIGSTFWVEIPQRKVLEESLYQARMAA
jgi:signal transduction histidine kinase